VHLFFDCEADNLLDNVSRLWCLAACDLDTDQEWLWGPDELEEGLAFLASASLLVAHNGLRYDLPVLKKLKGFKFDGEVHDTLVLARLSNSDIRNTDADLVASGKLDKKLHGSGSLKAWGQRIGIHKAEYEGGFGAYSDEMGSYCLQDCRTGKALWHHLDVPSMDPRSVWLEHRACQITFEMEQAGWCFDETKAAELYTELVEAKHVIETELVEQFGSWQEVDKVFVPKRDNKTLGYVKGQEVTKYKTVIFNPGSRRHIEKKLRELGWEPEEYTPSGQAKLDEDILLQIAKEYPEAKKIAEYMLLQKRLGQIADGDNGWLRVVKSDGRIHASYNTMGTVTGRCSHHNPNIAQVPKTQIGKNAEGQKVPLWGREGVWGADCRSLFGVPKGWKLVGADFEGLELRCLGAYMAHFDRGRYAEMVVDGDIHTLNQQAAGLPTRDNAKTFIYGFLYGAGPGKIGKIVGKGPEAGKKLQQKFLRGLPALAALRQAVATGAEKGWLKGLDGRHIPVRAKHAALNSLLQSAGAVLCKTWLVDAYDALLAAGYKWGYGGDFVIVGFIHDEINIACRAEIAEEVGRLITQCARDTGPKYDFKCRLDASYKIGDTWFDVH
jgi:DNA polymerase I-like protein with 3'-5' exonuclease and polymerase domains